MPRGDDQGVGQRDCGHQGVYGPAVAGPRVRGSPFVSCLPRVRVCSMWPFGTVLILFW